MGKQLLKRISLGLAALVVAVSTSLAGYVAPAANAATTHQCSSDYRVCAYVDVTTPTTIRITGYASWDQTLRVERSTSANGSYSVISTVDQGKTLSYYDKGLKPGVRYYYKLVDAATGVEYGPVSGLVTVQNYHYVKTVKAKTSGKNLKVSWSKVPGATHYQVKRTSTIYGKAKTIKTVKGVTSIVTAKPKKGKMYMYSVRAYTQVGSKKNYASTVSARDAFVTGLKKTKTFKAKKTGYHTVRSKGYGIVRVCAKTTCAKSVYLNGGVVYAKKGNTIKVQRTAGTVTLKRP